MKAQLNSFHRLSYCSYRKAYSAWPQVLFLQEYLSTHFYDKTDKVTWSLSVLLAGCGHQLGKHIHFYTINYLQEAASRIKFEGKECKSSTPTRNRKSLSGSRPHAEQFTGGGVTPCCLLAKIQKYLFYTIQKPLLPFPCVACAASSGVTVWDESWAATDPGPTALVCMPGGTSYCLKVSCFPYWSQV